MGLKYIVLSAARMNMKPYFSLVRKMHTLVPGLSLTHFPSIDALFPLLPLLPRLWS
jgi:hypothetical protein